MCILACLSTVGYLPFFMMQLDMQSLEAQEQFQVQALNSLKNRLLAESKFYQKQWQEKGFETLTLQSLADLRQFPFTTKEDIQLHESDFYCVDAGQFRAYNTTSGTLGQPVSIPQTANDLKRLSYNEQLSFEKLSIQKGEPVQLMLTLDRLFMAGMAYYDGLRALGANIIRTGAGVPQMQWDAIFRYQPTTLVAVPSFLIKMLDYADAHQIDYRHCSVQKVLAIGESLCDATLMPNALSDAITSRWNITLFSTYAATEMQTAFTACKYNCGNHQHSELIVVELIDDAGNPVPKGVIGEVCITTLGVEGMPLWRFKTGDMACLYDEPCGCGRNSPRLSGIVGRKKQMLKLKGTTLFPNAIFEALLQSGYTTDFVVEAFTNELEQDDIKIYYTAEGETRARLKEYLRSKLKIAPGLQLTTTDELRNMQFAETYRKQMKFIDNRV